MRNNREIKATGDYRDMTAWLCEKSQNTVRELARMVDTLNAQNDLNEELKESLMGDIHIALWDSLKILAFALDAEWTTKDAEIIEEQGKKGLDIILKRYRAK